MVVVIDSCPRRCWMFGRGTPAAMSQATWVCRLWGIPHKRHTHATLALQEGIHPRIVQERLGHSTISITLDIYSHVLPTMQEDAAAKIGAAVFGPRVDRQKKVTSG
jgi:integrase